MTPNHPDFAENKAIGREASEWVARRDRGLSSAEHEACERWLASDPRHRAALARHEQTLAVMRRLAELVPEDAGADADLFAAPKPVFWRRRWLAAVSAIAAAAAAFAFFLPRQDAPPASATPPAPSLPLASAPRLRILANEQHALPDGSLVELREGSRITPAFSPNERRVHLLAGEAYFTVAKDPARPFVVEVDGVSVQAVGTIFNVRLDPASVEVLVTEGKVRVRDAAGVAPPSAAPADSVAPPAPATPPLPVLVTAGQRAVVTRNVESAEVRVTEASRELIATSLSWQGARVQFNETPLADAVAELNRHNRVQLVLAPPSLGVMRIGGTFRPDNIDGFVRLLELTLGIKADRDGDVITLHR
ncbi:MAG: FecR domain-containing protein [Opitutaceae bacterium]|jgi:transmembrane sensor|nr:FecR domain-containing protein [Opitutaceae bacterium]